MDLFTIIAEFRGGTYCSQVYSEDVFSVQKEWIKCLERDKKEIKFLGDKIISELILEIYGENNQPTKLSTLNNIWYNQFSSSNGIFRLNIVKTNDQI
ncbi:hypothetical protein GCM10010992_22100 [Cloacibacterium rupense]|uniref:Uncharacterized protein n=1 Tax=Cloacibacterium rupense TaxID=517423 RepID=A0ABQ2NLS2_9FLAO|nr:hypothetical protein [Cloacibacterium rupense]GGP05554.1 hypothetical protein GCM10010992_22100 [Cloacibacterium rupense]